MKYRSEIDGLRAVAVVPVIMFHAGFELFSGGYVGVDVFFVISGYLITTIITNDIKNSDFSLFTFYERRARRILPALFFVMMCCIPFAFLLLMPSEFRDFAKSLIAVSTFSSNIFFWHESGYFAPSAELKPLLHTWSLAVEEQFYILFPLFLIVTRKFRAKTIFWTLIVSFMMSLALAHWGAYNKPGATFYWLPTRAWELLLGSLVAFFLQRRSITASYWVRNALSALGLAAIVYAVLSFDDTTPFPSLYGLFPTVGTVLIILFGSSGTWVQALLSLRSFVGIGLVSYSLYLWHQPVFSFWRHYSLIEPTHMQMLLLSVLCFPLAYLTYRIVETPFRGRAAWLSRSQILISSGVSLAVFIALGIVGDISNGLARATNRRISLASIEERLAGNLGLHQDCEGKYNDSRHCYTDEEPEVLLWGDSYAMHLMQGVIASDPDVKIQQHTKSACSPIIDAALVNQNFPVGWAKGCIDFNNSVLDWLENNPSVKLVVLSSQFQVFRNSFFSSSKLIQSSEGEEYLLDKFQETVDKIRLLGADVIVVSPTPYSGRDNGACLAKVLFRELREDACDFIDKGRTSYEFMHNARKFVSVYWLNNDICKNDICDVLVSGIFLYRDGGHLSKEGSQYLGGVNRWLPEWRRLAEFSE